MRYELVVIWATGEKDIFSYNSREEAEKAGAGMLTALGNQIDWYGVRKGTM